MSETNSNQFFRSRFGLGAECVVIGILAFLCLTVVLLVDESSLQFSLLAGTALGIFTTVLRYLVQR